MESQVNNPHDHFFRRTFAQPDDARAFLAHFLPKDVVELTMNS